MEVFTCKISKVVAGDDWDQTPDHDHDTHDQSE
jgi:hypothetical protein